MNSDMLVDMIQTIRDQKINVHSITIVRNGYVVMDSYFFPFPDNAKHNLRSCSKSVMSILIGIAIKKGYIKDVSQPVLSFFTDKTIANIDENKKKITVENLLTMTTGLECIDGYRHRNKGLYEMWRSKNWAQYVLDLPMIEAPGDRFEYCSGATYLLSAILQKTAGMRSLDFARECLFPP
jgi:CubicO group peptidase (beta-lactamase class C family)